jgi:metallo-beta-lactamase family protein
MFQGKGKERNQILPVKPSTIDHVLETHAHLDHFGLLPLLTKDEEGFT